MAIVAKVSLVSGFTIFSRILGLLRDVLFFAFFGSSVAGSAFLLAFTLPNLFRRMLGEGTLTSAFIPIFSETVEGKSRREGFRLLNKVLSWLSLALVGIVLLGICVSLVLQSLALENSPKWLLGIELCSWTLPYVIVICLSALVVGALNVRGSFFPGAASPIVLNLSMILALLICGTGTGLQGESLAFALCLAVLIGGILQLLLPVLFLRRLEGWTPSLDFGRSEELHRVKALFAVGALGAAVGQVNVLVSRFLGYSLDDEGAVSMLYLSSRLTELPLGVFAIAISTVVFPEMAKLRAKKDEPGFSEVFAKGLRLTLAVTIPAAAGLAFLATPILSALFQWGRFGTEEVSDTVPVLAIACAGLPFYAVAAYYVRAFHACKDMSVPLKAALLSLIMNLLLSLVLMQFWNVFGLAAANCVSAVIQTGFLHLAWKKTHGLSRDGLNAPVFLFPVIVSTIGMSIIVLFARSGIARLEMFSEKELALIEIVSIIPFAVLIYLLCLIVFSFPEAKAGASRLMERLSSIRSR